MIKKNILIAIIITLISFKTFGQTNIISSIIHQTYQRNFTIHTPAGFTNTIPTPLVIMLHGGGGNMTSAQGFTNLNSVSNANGFLAVYPEGYGIVPSGGFSWADGRGTSADSAGIDDVGFINNLLDYLIANYSINTNKMYICGFSNGGFMTQRLACQLNQRFAAMASLGSIMDTTLFANCIPLRAIPMMFVMGTDDPLVPYAGGVMNSNPNPIVSMETLVNFWKTNNNCLTSSPPINLPDINPTENSTVTVFNYTNCFCNSNISFYKINGGGHTWPGVEIPSYEVIAGQTNEDIQASVELWNFFNAYTLCNNQLGLDEQFTQNLYKIYPNPATTEININISSDKINEVSVINYLGQTIILTKNQTKIDISNLSNGLYFIKVKLGENTLVQKFIKQ